MLFHIVADYGQGDLAFAEVIQRIKTFLPDAEPVVIPVPPFSTLAAGFCVAQLALNEAPLGSLIYHNVAPRHDDPQRRRGNVGERLAFARLSTGARVIGVNAGFTFSFIKQEAEEIRWARVSAAGSQFRSRDLFPQAAAAIALGDPEALSDSLPIELIPEVPQSKIAYIDGYGNLKTTIKESELKSFQRGPIRIRIGHKELEAHFSDATFEVKAGQLAFAPGSSGWVGRDNEKVRWMELFLRDGSAAKSFGDPAVGSAIHLIPLI